MVGELLLFISSAWSVSLIASVCLFDWLGLFISFVWSDCLIGLVCLFDRFGLFD